MIESDDESLDRTSHALILTPTVLELVMVCPSQGAMLGGKP